MRQNLVGLRVVVSGADHPSTLKGRGPSQPIDRGRGDLSEAKTRLANPFPEAKVDLREGSRPGP